MKRFLVVALSVAGALALFWTVRTLVVDGRATGRAESVAASSEAPQGPSARELELEEELRELRSELETARADLRRLAARGERTEVTPALEEPRSPERPPTAAAPDSAPFPSEPASEPVAAWLRRVLPDRYGKLTDEELAQLTELELRGAPVTDSDLLRLAALPRLESLGLHGANITEQGILNLRLLPALQSLDLRGTHLNAACLSYLGNFRLEALHLTDTQLTASDLELLPDLPNLQTLKLNSLRLGDDAVDVVARYPSVRHLELDGTSLTAAGLKRLLALNPLLTRIELRKTLVSREAAGEIAALHPGCQLVLD